MIPAPRDLARLRKSDPRLARAMAQLPPFPGFPRPRHYQSHFHALSSAIIHQQLATKAAQTIHGRVLALTSGPRFPSAEELLELPHERLRGAGLSQGKLLALCDLARKSLDGTLGLERIARLDDGQVIERLIQVRGIGEWTARMFLLFRLGRLDVLAPNDLGLQEGLKKLDGLAERPKPEALERRAEAWRPLRSVASWYLWRLVSP